MNEFKVGDIVCVVSKCKMWNNIGIVKSINKGILVVFDGGTRAFYKAKSLKLYDPYSNQNDLYKLIAGTYIGCLCRILCNVDDDYVVHIYEHDIILRTNKKNIGIPSPTVATPNYIAVCDSSNVLICEGESMDAIYNHPLIKDRAINIYKKINVEVERLNE